MRRPILGLGLFVILGWALAGQSDRVAYGKYLVEEVGKCQDCHSPRLENGEFDKTKWMKGSEFNLQPITPVKGWHKKAPDLTPGSRLWMKWGEAALVKFLTTGLGPGGQPPEPPMAAYKMKQADAEAVVEYLKSLK